MTEIMVDYSALFEAALQSDNIFDNSSDSDTETIASTTKSDLSTHLSVSASQHRAITYPARPGEIVRIVAGPGSGKTFTVTARIAHLLQNGTKPHQVLVLCMANRSVDAVRAALISAVGEATAKNVTVSTFHSFCALVIDLHGTRRRVLDKRTWRNMARAFLAKLMLLENHSVQGDVSAAALERILEGVASGAFTVKEAAVTHKISPEYLAAVVRYIRAQGVGRFDDLVHECVELLAEAHSEAHVGSSDPEVKSPADLDVGREGLAVEREGHETLMDLLAACTAVFVDECQDIHPLLLQVIKAVVTYPTKGVASPHKHLTVAGDPRQCIYEFLGARRETMAELPLELAPMRVVDVPLQKLFRCPQPILDAAMDLCPGAVPLDLIPLGRLEAARRCDGVRPVFMHNSSTSAEFAAVGTEIARLLCCLGGLLQPRDVAVLTRTNAEAEQVEQVLTDTFGVACARIVPGNAWVDLAMHIYRDVISVIVGEGDAGFSLLTLLTVLDTAKGSRARAAKAFSHCFDAPYADSANGLEAFLFDELMKIEQGDVNASRLHRIYKNFPEQLENIAGFLNQLQLERKRVHMLHAQHPLDYTPVELVRCLARMAKFAGIHEFVFRQPGGTKNYGNAILDSFNASLHHSFNTYANSIESQAGQTFMEYFLHTYNNEVPPTSGNAVRISTIHSAKGLEFPVVFVLGLYNYRAPWEKLLLPSPEPPANFSIHHLLFVAFTRARHLLYIGSSLAYEALPELTRMRLQQDKPQFMVPLVAAILSTDLPVRAGPAGELSAAADLTAAFDRLSVAPAPEPSRLFRTLAADLKRDMPLPEKMARGERLFAKLFPEKRDEGFAARPRHVAPRGGLNGSLASSLKQAKGFLKKL